MDDLQANSKDIYKGVETQQYLKDSKISIDKKQLLFKLRTRMLDIKENFSFLYLDEKCTLGCDEVESQEHLLNCKAILEYCSELSDDLDAEYDDIVSTNSVYEFI